MSNETIKNIFSLKEANLKLLNMGIKFDDRIKHGNSYIYFVDGPNGIHVAYYTPKEKILEIIR